jgi:hypothetical protein
VEPVWKCTRRHFRTVLSACDFRMRHSE